jgi:hypothetical protein
MENYINENYNLFTSIEIKQDLSLIDDDNKIFLSHGKLFLVLDKNEINDITHISEIFNIKNKKRILLNIPTDYHLYIYPYLNFGDLDQKPPFLCTYINKVREHNLFKSFIKKDSKYYLNYYLKNSLTFNNVQKYISNNIYDTIKTLHRRYTYEENTQSLNKYNKVDKFNIGFTEPDLILKDDITLYNYQIEDIKWMYWLTDNIYNKTNKIKYNIPLTIDINDEYIMYLNNIYTKTDFDKYGLNKFKQDSLEYYGGNIVSEMGLGKTLISLYYILSFNKTRDYFNFFIDETTSNKCNYFYKRGKNTGKNCEKKKTSELFCNEHKSTVFIDKKRVQYKNHTFFELNNFIQSDHIQSNGSLILCPPHLCDQWVTEYYSKFKDKYRVLLIVTSDQFKNTTFGDILFSDIIIVSYQMFVKYLLLSNPINSKIGEGMFKLSPKNLFESTEYNNLFLFRYNHLFLDECHEIGLCKNNIRITKNVAYLKSNTIWNITGTPFTQGMSSLSNLLGYNTNYRLKYYTEYIDNVFLDNIKILFRRNIKSNIENELQKNIITEHVNKITFTTHERNIYTSNMNKNINFLIKLCCDIELNKETKELIQN